MYEFCSPELQEKLKLTRAAKLKAENAALAGSDESKVNENTTPSGQEAAMDVDDDVSAEDQEALRLAMKLSMGETADEPPPAPTTASPSRDLPSESFTGQYELIGVITHAGRHADAGHYVAWVRQEPGSSYWWKFDDEKVSEVYTENVLFLKGGGDSDCAYLSFYRYKE